MPILAQIKQQLGNATSTTEADRSFDRYMKQLGISLYSFTYYGLSTSSVTKLKYSYASPEYRLWHQHYVTEGYQDIDSTMSSLQQGVLPIFWDVHEQLANARSERERQMRLDSINFGVDNGLVIPLFASHGDFATMVITKSPELDIDIQRMESELFYFAYCYFDTIKRLFVAEQQHDYGLSKRERQVLQGVCENLSVTQIASKYGITPRTVNFHIQRINKKLDCQNKYQSAQKALSLGLLVV